MGKINSREKGKRAENALVHILREHGYENAHRSQQYCGSTGQAADIVDAIPGLHIECKHQERMELYRWYEQACRDSEKTAEIPVVIHKANKKPWLVSLSLDDFLKIIGQPIVDN